MQFLMLGFQKIGRSKTEEAFIKMEAKLRVSDRTEVDKNQERSWRDYLALTVATCGVGYMPIASGTWGSMVGVGIYLLAHEASERFTVWCKANHLSNALLESSLASFTLIFLIVLFLIGVWAATRVEKMTGKKDPGIVIIDEIVGQLVTFLFVPHKMGWWVVITGFLMFRLFDIWKPYPTYKFESLPLGLGTMSDDAMAGFYAAVVMSLLCSIYLSLF
jgi:phosphatidylglycerophosphatase A